MEMLPAEVATELSMRAKDHGYGAFILVEGATDEALVKGFFVDEITIGVVPIGHSQAVRNAISFLVTPSPVTVGLKPALGVIDSDYLIPLGHATPSAHLLLTDLRDVECMMFGSNAYSAVCREYLSDEKLQKRWASAQNMQKKILEVARVVGALRFWSQQTEAHISFKGLDFSKFVDLEKMSIDHAAMVRHINGYQSKAAKEREKRTGVPEKPKFIEEQNIKEALDLLASPPYANYFNNDLLICRGHDIMEILASLLKGKVGNKAAAQMTGDDLERSFRFTFLGSCAQTNFVKSIRAWVSTLGYQAKLA